MFNPAYLTTRDLPIRSCSSYNLAQQAILNSLFYPRGRRPTLGRRHQRADSLLPAIAGGSRKG